jgi:hypothetical protein
VQQVADDREGNSHAEPDRHGGKPFIDFHSLKAWHDDLSPEDKVSRSLDVIVYWARRGGMVAGRRLAMDHAHGWFSDNKVWIEFIIATVLLWLLMMTAIYELDLRSAG